MLIVVKIQPVMIALVILMIFPNDNSGPDANDDRIDGDNSDGKTNDGADGHRNDEDDDDGGCLDSVKNCFKNKQIDLENFSFSSLIPMRLKKTTL